MVVVLNLLNILTRCAGRVVRVRNFAAPLFPEALLAKAVARVVKATAFRRRAVLNLPINWVARVAWLPHVPPYAVNLILAPPFTCGTL